MHQQFRKVRLYKIYTKFVQDFYGEMEKFRGHFSKPQKKLKLKIAKRKERKLLFKFYSNLSFINTFVEISSTSVILRTSIQIRDISNDLSFLSNEQP